MTILKTFCRCGSLRTGTLIAGFAGIILAVVGIIVIFTVNVDLRTIVMDWLPKWAVKIIITINFAMTIFISLLLILGVVKRNMFLMLPWVILGIFLAIGLLVSVLYTSINFYLGGFKDEEKKKNDDQVDYNNKDDYYNNIFNGTIWLVFGLLAVVIYIYMWLVVFSFFSIIKKEYDRGAYSRDPFRRK